MITAFIDTGQTGSTSDAKALARTLNGLVAATVDGLLRDVVLFAPAADEVARAFAEHSGGECRTHAEFPAALGAARGDWLLLLEAGVLLEPGWLEHVAAHVQGGREPACFSRSPHAPRPFFERYLKAERPLALGLLIPKAQAILLSRRASGMAELAAATRPSRLAASLRPAF
jgi:hypothetical protein